jgi:hypothetical protein
MSDDDAYIMGFNQLGVMSNLPWQDFFYFYFDLF